MRNGSICKPIYSLPAALNEYKDITKHLLCIIAFIGYLVFCCVVGLYHKGRSIQTKVHGDAEGSISLVTRALYIQSLGLKIFLQRVAVALRTVVTTQ